MHPIRNIIYIVLLRRTKILSGQQNRSACSDILHTINAYGNPDHNSPCITDSLLFFLNLTYLFFPDVTCFKILCKLSDQIGCHKHGNCNIRHRVKFMGKSSGATHHSKIYDCNCLNNIFLFRIVNPEYYIHCITDHIPHNCQIFFGNPKICHQLPASICDCHSIIDHRLHK